MRIRRRAGRRAKDLANESSSSDENEEHFIDQGSREISLRERREDDEENPAQVSNLQPRKQRHSGSNSIVSGQT